jgi:hypothetical protein
LACFGLGNLEENQTKICKMWIPGSLCYFFLAIVTNKKAPGKVYAGGLSWGFGAILLAVASKAYPH